MPLEEMYRTFNMGIGMVLVVAPEEEEAVLEHLEKAGEACCRLGRVTEGAHIVSMKGGDFCE